MSTPLIYGLTFLATSKILCDAHETVKGCFPKIDNEALENTSPCLAKFLSTTAHIYNIVAPVAILCFSAYAAYSINTKIDEATGLLNNISGTMNIMK